VVAALVSLTQIANPIFCASSNLKHCIQSTIDMPELTASYTSPAPEHNLSVRDQIEFTDSREKNMKNLTTQLLSLKVQLNDHFTNELTASGERATNGQNEAAEEEADEEEEDESEDPNGGMVKISEANNGRAKRPKTN
jgi:hypothetical protein